MGGRELPFACRGEDRSANPWQVTVRAVALTKGPCHPLVENAAGSRASFRDLRLVRSNFSISVALRFVSQKFYLDENVFEVSSEAYLSMQRLAGLGWALLVRAWPARMSQRRSVFVFRSRLGVSQKLT